MTGRQPTPDERDERVVLPLDPETALRALLTVKPDAPSTEPRDEDGPQSPGSS